MRSKDERKYFHRGINRVADGELVDYEILNKDGEKIKEVSAWKRRAVRKVAKGSLMIGGVLVKGSVEGVMWAVPIIAKGAGAVLGLVLMIGWEAVKGLLRGLALACQMKDPGGGYDPGWEREEREALTRCGCHSGGVNINVSGDNSRVTIKNSRIG
jgi:hypothetical protein